ncbi:MAG: carboxysome shell carbonic anhydrase [Gammaproteobacteria bacterium]|nr:carboxysome shell carbonic anhydrase [Gammaproteobacteria bacterium]MBU1646012.1 carboxysome shell carbonic anhydrase [Gammaproteobacteria bacterium]MBU1972074.1 carboxysome shell carbonic anhydrase [Gammaproteobacteria bacterium]
MDIHSKPIQQRIDWVFEVANRHGADYRSPEAYLARERYLAEHPTAIAVLKCMDGRINIPVATNTPVGLLMPFRNLGGMFDLGWPHLGEMLAHHVQRMVSSGRRVLFLITYHYSKGDPKRGCAGFNYDTEAAIAHTYQIRRQVEHIFGGAHGTVYPLVCGFETDEDTLVIHGADGHKLDLCEIPTADRGTLAPKLAALLPDMPAQMRADLLPLLHGNLDRIEQVRAQNRRGERALDIEHREWMICLGRGFDFLHTPNLALIIGPYSPNLDVPIRTAASIIGANMAAGRIPSDGFLLLASVPYDEIGVDRARAELKSRFLSKFAADVIAADHPELAGKMAMRTTLLDWRSRRLEALSSET